MRYGLILSVLGLGLMVMGAVQRGWGLLAVWLGADFLILAIAHAIGAHGVFGKRPDGRLSRWSWVLYFPMHVCNLVVWHSIRILGREPASNVLTDQVVVGRLLLPVEVDEGFDNYVDLTAEFAEPAAIRRAAGYVCFPILDGAAPQPEALRAVIQSLRPGRTYIHCAQGHGRTGLFALALLLTSGAALNVVEGMAMLATARPGIRLNGQQRRCIEAFAAT